MSVYYVDVNNGADINDGLTPETPKKDYTLIELSEGDTVLLKKGQLLQSKASA